YLAWNVSLRQSFSSRSGPDLDNLNTVVQRIDWLPPAWPGHALSSIIAGNVSSAVTWTLLTLLLGVALVVAASILYERTLLAGLGIFGSTQSLWRRRTRAAPTSARGTVARGAA